MIRRCYATNAENYARYGGRGITVCDRWLNDFWAFVCDMGERPKDTTLDRKDNDANYEPGNCRWAVKIIQSVNRRSAAVEFAPGHNPCRFTPAEMLVLHEIGKGLRYSKVASNLEISTRTVEIHASRLLEKSGADCLFMLGVWYAKNFPERCA